MQISVYLIYYPFLCLIFIYLAIDPIDPHSRNNWKQRPKMRTLLIHKAERGVREVERCILHSPDHWRIHKGLECLASGIEKRKPPRMISDQIAYKLKCAIEHFFLPKSLLSQYYLLLLYSSIITQAKEKNS